MSTHVWQFGNTRGIDGTGLVTVVCNSCGEVRAAEAVVGATSLLNVKGDCAGSMTSRDGESLQDD